MGVNALETECRCDLPEPLDAPQLGLDLTRISRVRLFHRSHGSRVYRVGLDDQSFVLKWFDDPSQATEVRAYALLEQLAVPTLPVHGRTPNAILLGDLATSAQWRLAGKADVEEAETGAAVAAWYRQLHAAGRAILAHPGGPPAFLRRESDELDAGTVLRIGDALGLAAHPVWQLAAEHIEALTAAARSLPETLNYNDFHWSNLALSRRCQPSLRAIVFDYHLLGIGLAYSDCRNVVGSLGSRAKAAFLEAYGPTDCREALLDAPLSILYTLKVALARPHFPSWARGCFDAVASGELERHLREALEILAC